jgi:UDP:flavonoid glycosyltransferase YjiC (YdhE family)
MRVLVVTSPGTGHIVPVLPLAEALATGGHEILWATGRDATEMIERAGLSTVAVGPPGAEYMRDLTARYPMVRDLAPAERHAFITPRLFTEIIAPRVLPDLLQVVEDWRADVVVHEDGELASPIAAAAAGIPKVTVGIGPCDPRSIMLEWAERIAPLWHQHHLTPPAWCGLAQPLRIDICPPRLRSADCEVCAGSSLLRPGSLEADLDDEPIPLPDGDAPLVYVTFGTVVNRPRTSTMGRGPQPVDIFRNAVEAVADLEVRALVTVGDNGDPGMFESLPPRVRVERFVPQARVLPHASLVISHGGSGTMLGALAHGLPQLCLPQAAGQFENGALIHGLGAGLFLPPDEATVDAIRRATQRLLIEPTFLATARDVQRDQRHANSHQRRSDG